MNQNELKQAVAQAAIDHIVPQLKRESIVGVGTGSTANYFIDALANIKHKIEGAVASSEATAERLKSLTGWSAKTSIEDGVQLLVNHYSKEYIWLIQ